MNKINKEILDVISKSWEFQHSDKNWYEKIENEQDAMDLLLELKYKIISSDSRRWWNDIEVVAEFPTKDKTYYIGWWDAETTGDLSPDEVGWEFDPDSIRFYEKETVIIEKDKYTRIE